jgi:hypothetical protein
MADISDVLDVLTQTIATAIYPNGTGQPSINGTNTKIEPGWPDANGLDADMAAGNVVISIYPRPEERNTTRFRQQWQTVSVSAPTLTATIAGNQITIGGTVSSPQTVVAILNSTPVSMGEPYAYAVQPTDTLDTIASGLAALIPNATASGAVVTVGGSLFALSARISTPGVMAQEIGRQQRLIQITVWAPSQPLRDVTASALDVALRLAQRVVMPDGFWAALMYKGTPMTDMLTKQAIFRRDVLYEVEYATTVSRGATTVSQGTPTTAVFNPIINVITGTI